MVKYSQTVIDNKINAVSARGDDLRVHFKNTFETGAAIRGMKLLAARRYLEDVLDHKRCIPFARYNQGIGRTAQAKEFKVSQGRWPEKSVKVFLGLIQNLIANAEAKELKADDLVISHLAVQQAMKGRRRTYRAHGRINPYMSNPCHVELICKVLKTDVPKPETDSEHKTIKLTKKRNASRRLRIGAF